MLSMFWILVALASFLTIALTYGWIYFIMNLSRKYVSVYRFETPLVLGMPMCIIWAVFYFIVPMGAM